MSGLKILIIEKDPEIHQKISALLQKYEKEKILITSPPEKAIKIVKKQLPDIVIFNIKEDNKLNQNKISKIISRDLNIPILCIISQKISSKKTVFQFVNSYQYIKEPLEEEEFRHAIKATFYQHKLKNRVKENTSGIYASQKSTLFVCRFLKSGKIIYANKPFLNFFGIQNLEIIKEKFFFELFKEDINELQNVLAKIEENNISSSHTHDIKRSDSKECRLKWIIDGIFDKEGNITEYLAIGQDLVCPALENEQVLQELKLFNLLMDNIPDTVYFKDKDSKFIKINKAQAKILGLKNPQEAVGLSDFDFFEHAEQAFNDEQEMMKTGKSLISKLEKINIADGSYRWVTDTKIPYMDETGKYIGTFGITRDVTELKEKERLIGEQEEKFKILVDNLPEVIIVHKDMKILFVNNYIKEMSGYDSQYFINKKIDVLMDKENYKIIEEKYANQKNEETIVPFEVTIKHKSGMTIPVIIFTDNIVYQRERASISILSDLREQKKREKEIQIAREKTEKNNFNLEKLVKETEEAKQESQKANKELANSLAELKRFNNLMMEREGRVLELKEEVNNLLIKLGKKKKYSTAGLE